MVNTNLNMTTKTQIKSWILITTIYSP